MTLRRRMLLTFSTLILMFSVVLVKITATDERPFIELSRPDRGKVFAIAWNPDGQYIAVGTEQGLWIYTDTFADVTHAEGAPIHALAWSPDGKTIAAGYFGKEPAFQESKSTYLVEGGGLRLWSVQPTANSVNLAEGEILLRDGSVYSTRFNADGSQIALLAQTAYVYGEDKWAQDKLQIFEPASGNLLYDSPPSDTVLLQDDKVTFGANGLDWSVDGELAVIRNVYSDGKSALTIIDTKNNQFTPRSFPLISIGRLSAIGWSGDKAQLAVSNVHHDYMDSGGNLNMCYLDAALYYPNGTQCTDTRIFEQPYTYDDVLTLAWRPDSSQLTYTEGTKIRFWDSTAQKQLADLDAAYADVTMLDWNPDGTKLLSAGSDYVVRLWMRFDAYQAPEPQPIQTITLPLLQTTYDATIISPDGQWIADIYNSDDQLNNQVNVIRAKDGNTQVSFSYSLYIEDVYWSPDERMLAISMATPRGGRKIEIWSVESGSMVLDVGEAVDFAWRPDSRAFASSTWGNDGTGVYSNYQEIRVYAVPSGNLIQTSPPSRKWDKELAFQRSEFDYHSFDVAMWSPDGRYVALNDTLQGGMYDGLSIILWDTQLNVIAGELLTPRTIFVGSGGFAQILGWSPDGKTAIAEGYTNIYLYRLTPTRNRLAVDIIWHPPLPLQADYRFNRTIYSPDGHYLFHADTVIDTHTGWPVFKFRSTMLDYLGYRWVGDTLTGFILGDETTPGMAVSVRTSDFLPQ